MSPCQVKSSFDANEDATHQRKKAAKRKTDDENQRHLCEVCGDSFDMFRALSTHRWSKHRIKSSVRTSLCPVCGLQASLADLPR